MTYISIKQELENLSFCNIDSKYKLIQFVTKDKTISKSIENQKFNINLADLIHEFEEINFTKINVYLVYEEVLTYKEALIRNINLEEYFPDIKFRNYYQLDDLLKIDRKKKINIKDMEISIEPFEKIAIEDVYITPYFDKNASFSLTLLPYMKLNTYFNYKQIDKFKVNDGSVYLEGKFSLINSILQKADLVIEHRESGNFVKWPLNIFKSEQNQYQTYNAYYYKINEEDHLRNVLNLDLKDGDTLDIYFEITINTLNTPFKIKIGNPRILVERFLDGKIRFEHYSDVYYLMPYFTLKGRNLSFKIAKLNLESDMAYKKYNKSQMTDKEIWVVGERHYKAQDNGYHFFKYMREFHREIETYYIIDKNSLEYKNVKDLGNVIDYRSPKHFEIMSKASKVFTTHHPELIFPMNDKKYVKNIKAERIFLQHGVLGTKNLTQINGNQLNDFNVDMFICSSEREKQIVLKDLKFKEEQIKITGLARFDQLFLPTSIKNQILIIPTWRDWLTNIEKFLESDYYNNFNQLIHNDLFKTLSAQGTEIVFCLHPNMQNFLKYFDIPDYIKAVSQGEVDVQMLIKESKLMITDYSSVAFDFSFLFKPVIYYQFDKKRFIGKSLSHLDIEKELPGYIVNNENELIEKLLYLKNNNFEIDNEIRQRVNHFIKYRDTNNSERIFKEARSFRNTDKNINNLKYDILTQHLIKRFRKNKNLYFNSMKLLNVILTKYHPVNPNLIFIESNLGKTVSDSPKKIYDELIKKNKDFKIVWVSNNLFPFYDQNTITVKRLSVAYFYYLSISKYWINNQNFPYYIKKHKDTKYIQTWHGTPLKKMLNDVDHFEGRDEGYKERVNIATSKWDYLISPSRYATNCFKSAFNFKNEILEIGYPRNDIYYQLNDNEKENLSDLIKLKIGIKDNRKIILYAPTFRDDLLKENSIDLPFDLNKLKVLADNYILLIKPHMLVGRKLNIPEQFNNFVYNVYNYSDINDLFLISDICITDYSSVMFDFANTKNPIIFYTYDLEKYRDQLRGFYMDLESDAPGPLVKDTDALLYVLLNINEIKEKYENKYELFYKKYCEFENGTSSKYIVDKILI